MWTDNLTDAEVELFSRLFERVYPDSLAFSMSLDSWRDFLITQTDLPSTWNKCSDAPLEEMPLWVNSPDKYPRLLALWRLQIGR